MHTHARAACRSVFSTKSRIKLENWQKVRVKKVAFCQINVFVSAVAVSYCLICQTSNSYVCIVMWWRFVVFVFRFSFSLVYFEISSKTIRHVFFLHLLEYIYSLTIGAANEHRKLNEQITEEKEKLHTKRKFVEQTRERRFPVELN